MFYNIVVEVLNMSIVQWLRYLYLLGSNLHPPMCSNISKKILLLKLNFYVPQVHFSVLDMLILKASKIENIDELTNFCNLPLFHLGKRRECTTWGLFWSGPKSEGNVLLYLFWHCQGWNFTSLINLGRNQNSAFLRLISITTWLEVGNILDQC